MNKNVEVLGDFMRYCRLHPELRFYQALAAWSGYDIIARTRIHLGPESTERNEDTFYWEGKNK
jgi:hypothetical protein